MNNSVRDKSAPVASLKTNTHVSSYSSSDLWPHLPDRLPEDIANAQFLERMEHVQALDSEQRGDAAEVSATAGPQPENAESSVKVWPWTGEGTGAKSAAASLRIGGRSSSQAGSKQWPDLPDMTRENIESTQFLRRLEHVQALDSEQRGAS